MLKTVRRIACAVAALCFCAIVTSCGKEEMTAMEKVQKQLSDMTDINARPHLQEFQTKAKQHTKLYSTIKQAVNTEWK